MVKLGAGHGAWVSRSACRDALMPPRLEDRLRDGRAVGRVPRDRGRSGGRTPARAHPASGLRNVGAAARRVRTLPAVTLSNMGGQRERTRSRRSARASARCPLRHWPSRSGHSARHEQAEAGTANAGLRPGVRQTRAGGRNEPHK
jgi:hypothetical protein